MAQWYAVITSLQSYETYGPNQVVSFGTRVASADYLQQNGLAAVPIGDYGQSGPPFTKMRFDMTTKKLVPV